VLAATTAIQAALDTGEATLTLLSVAASGLVIVFGMWWLYFATPTYQLLTSRPVPFIWGYGLCWRSRWVWLCQAAARPWAVHRAWMRVGRRWVVGRGSNQAPRRRTLRAMPVRTFCRWVLGMPR